jgi:hypothetical protein
VHARRFEPPSSIADLCGRCTELVVVRAVAGSHLYGLAGPESDRDERGLFALPPAAYAGLEAPPEHLQDERGDEVWLALRKFFGLLLRANPNAIELLYTPADCILERTAAFDRIVAARDLFLSKRWFDSHVGYAKTQIRRARGHNKWINNPQPERPPQREDFCRVVLGPWPGEVDAPAAGDAVPPLRPRPLASSGIDLREFHCSALEHAPGVYRLYHYGPVARGVFRGGAIVCESIPLADEFSRLRGLLLFDEAAFLRAVENHRGYHQWRAERNEARWRSQERGEIDYDAKNMMHTFRLIASVAGLLRDGRPTVRFEGETREFLLQVRSGALGYDELVQRAEDEVAALRPLFEASDLPDEPDERAIGALLDEVVMLHMASIEAAGGRGSEDRRGGPR